jgi:predicted nucleotidyltransferase
MDRTLPLREVFLFGSHARGDARPDSDVDLCLVAEGAERQLQAAQLWIAESDLSVIRLALAPEIGFSTCRGGHPNPWFPESPTQLPPKIRQYSATLTGRAAWINRARSLS